MSQKRPQTKVDKILGKLSENQLKQFKELCKFNANYSTLKQYLKSCGYEVSTQNLSTWWIANKPRGKEAVLINALSEMYTGTEPKPLLQMSAGICAKLADKLNQLLETEIESTTPSSKLSNLVEILKELRQASSDLHNLKVEENTEDLIYSGALELSEKLKNIFKDTPFETALETGIKAGLAQISSQKF